MQDKYPVRLDCEAVIAIWKKESLENDRPTARGEGYAQVSRTPALTRLQAFWAAPETVATRHGRRLKDYPFGFRDTRLPGNPKMHSTIS